MATLCVALFLPLDAWAQQGSNAFGPVTWYESGNVATYSVAVGDLNDDGSPDLVVSTQCTNPNCSPTWGHTGVFVWINNGNGTFGPRAAYETDGYGGNPWTSVAIADMDGDARPDLVVLNAGNTTYPSNVSVSVMRGNGDGTFQPAVSALLNVYPFYASALVLAQKLTVADVNGDGSPDVLVANAILSAGPQRAGVSVLMNRGDGTLDDAVVYDSGGYMAALDVTAADMNGDGLLDIVAVNACSTLPCANNPATVAVMRGNGDGTFQQPVSYTAGGSYPSFGSGPSSLAAADLNRDGTPDLLLPGCATTCGFPDSLWVLLGNGDGSFQPPVRYDDGAQRPVSIAAGDVDGDGLADALVLDACAAGLPCDGRYGTLSVLAGNGTGTLQGPALQNIWAENGGFGWAPNTVVLADLDSDGKLDAVVAAYAGVGVLLNQTERTTQYVLTTAANPPAGGSITAGGSFDAGTSVVITATAAAGYVFTGFSGDLSGTTNPGSVVMDAAKTVTANFQAITYPGYTLTSPAGGSLVPCGQPLTVTWTGGNLADTVNILLLDEQTYAVWDGFGYGPNTGSRVVTIGPGSCGRRSSFYIEDVARTTWSYGPVFLVAAADAAPPVLTLPGDLTIEATGPAGTVVTFAASAHDDVDGALPISCSPASGSTFPLGTTTVSCSASDAAGHRTTEDFRVTVRDTTSPVVTDVAPDTLSLWPPNGKFVPVTVAGRATDGGGGLASASYRTVDEYGEIQPAGTIAVGPGGAFTFTLQLEARRRGTDRDGRTYTVTITVTDRAGNQRATSVVIRVPHDQGQ